VKTSHAFNAGRLPNVPRDFVGTLVSAYALPTYAMRHRPLPGLHSRFMTIPLPQRPHTEMASAPLLGHRAVRRAVLDLRQGLPVIIDGAAPAVVLPAETATAASLAEWQQATMAPGVLVLAPTRAAAVLHQPVAPGAAAAVALPHGPHTPGLTPELLLALADPTRAQGAGVAQAPLPPLSETALLLAKIGRLLPAMIMAPLHPGAAPWLLHVAAPDVLAHPDTAAATLTRVAEAHVPLAEAPDARLVAFRPTDGGIEHLALLIGRPETVEAPLVRLHSECFTGDALGSLRCDCGPQLDQAIRRMAAEGAGVLLYLAQEGRGIGLVNKLRAYALQDAGLDTLDANRALGWGADERSFVPAATMLQALGIHRIRLLTNNPEKIAALRACGIDVAGRVSHAIAANGVNDSYLQTKARRFGHLLG
jgi:GTP cyclohydrolase II